MLYRGTQQIPAYSNEEEVGSAIQKSGVARKDIFLTSKVWIEHYDYDECRGGLFENEVLKAIGAAFRHFSKSHLSRFRFCTPS